MSGINLNAITENASRFGTRLQETFSEHTRDLAIGRGSSAAYFDTPEEKVKNIRKQLDSNSDREKLDAMKRLIAVRIKLPSPAFSLKLDSYYFLCVGIGTIMTCHHPSSYPKAETSRNSSLK